MNSGLAQLCDEIAGGRRIGLSDIDEAVGPSLPLLRELEHTEQDPEWHGEGNVRIHTERVLEELYRVVETDASVAEADLAGLVLAAALHDIAKPSTTRRETIQGVERVVAPRHADKGRTYLAKRLPGLGVGGSLLDVVLALVGHHHDPLRLSRRNATAGHYLRLARSASPQWLYLLETADLRGRVCSDLDAQLDALDFYALRCEEEGLLNEPPRHLEWAEAVRVAFADERPELRAVASAQAILDAENDLVRSEHEAIARSYKYRDPFPALYVLCGASGSGKSTWAQDNVPDAEIISLDAIRQDLYGSRRDRKHEGQVVQEAKLRLKRALAAKRTVVWDSTGLVRERRAGILRLGFDYGGLVRLVAFNHSLSTLLSRNERRRDPVPASVLEKQFEGFELPYAHEAHEVYLLSEGDESHSPLGVGSVFRELAVRPSSGRIR